MRWVHRGMTERQVCRSMNNVCEIFWEKKLFKNKNVMPFSTGDSHFVPNSSTEPAQRCLTSQFWWDAVGSSWYDRKTSVRYEYLWKVGIWKDFKILWKIEQKKNMYANFFEKKYFFENFYDSDRSHPQLPEILQYRGHVWSGWCASVPNPRPRLKQFT